jgi:hypothetical protein
MPTAWYAFICRNERRSIYKALKAIVIPHSLVITTMAKRVNVLVDKEYQRIW